MTTFLSRTTHTIDAHFPRENPLSTISPDDRLKIVFNVYTDSRVKKRLDSNDNPDTQLNLVFVHGTQMCKEVWEYMIEKVFNTFSASQIGCIAAVDSVNHGESYLANKGKLGSICTWSDGGKDLICVLKYLNLTRGTTILLGHSMGGGQCSYAALYEPNLIDSIVLFDPVGYYKPEEFNRPEAAKVAGELFYKLTRFVRAEFKDAEDYRTYMTKKGVSRTFHPRIREDYIKYGAETNSDGSVSFKTSKEQQIISYFSSQYATREVFHFLPILKPVMLHVAGEVADWNPPYAHEGWISRTPRSEGVSVLNGAHLFPFDLPDQTFDAILPFLKKRLELGSQNSIATSKRANVTSEERQQYVSKEIDRYLGLLKNGNKIFYSKL